MIGRVIVNDNPATLALDLKGVVYDASFLPSVSMLVVNPTKNSEAQVEAVLSSFVRLDTREGQRELATADDDEFDKIVDAVLNTGGGDPNATDTVGMKRKAATPVKKKRKTATTKRRKPAAKPKAPPARK